MKAKKFTFKKYVPTGLMCVTHRGYAEIKLSKENVGYTQRNEDGVWVIRFKVIDETDNKGWRWTTLLNKPKSYDEVKSYVNQNHIQIQNLKLFIG